MKWGDCINVLCLMFVCVPRRQQVLLFEDDVYVDELQ